MNFVKATRGKCKMKLSIQGPSGSGKTFSALRLAKGLVGDLSKLAVIDTECGSSHLYAHLGDYSVVTIEAPYSPEKYIHAIHEAVKKGFECIVIDSLSHEWQGSGGILDIHGQMEGNSFTNWSKVTPRHNALIQTIVNANVHVLSTLRSKTEYVIQNRNGKSVPEKVGMKAVQREDAEYEFTIAFELNKQHGATISKDRTGLFAQEPEILITEDVGARISTWCDADSSTAKEVSQQEDVKTPVIDVTRSIYNQPPPINLLSTDPSQCSSTNVLLNQLNQRHHGNF